jgi:hypothetical protein
MATPAPAKPPAAPFDQTSPDQLRKAIIARMGIDPTKLTAFGGNPTFDNNVTNLYRSALSKLAGYDTQTQRVGSDYTTNLSQLQQRQDLASKSLQGSLADRGLLYTGNALTQQAQQGQDYQNQLQALNQARSRSLEDITTNRNNTIYDELSGRGNYESQYTQNLNDYLTQQATAAAQVAQQQKLSAQVAASTAASQAAAKAATAAAKRPTTAAITRAVAPKIAAPANPYSGFTGGVVNPTASKLPLSKSLF